MTTTPFEMADQVKVSMRISCSLVSLPLLHLTHWIGVSTALEHVVYKRTLDINSQDVVSRTIYLSVYSIDFIVVC